MNKPTIMLLMMLAVVVMAGFARVMILDRIGKIGH